MTAIDHGLVLLTLRNHLRTLDDLPPDAQCAWENMDFTPTTGVDWIEEDLVPGPAVKTGLSVGGPTTYHGLYIIKSYTAPNVGITNAYGRADAIRDLFPASLAFTLADGNVLRVRGDVAPSRGQLRQSTTGFAVIPVTIPYSLITY